MALTAAGVEKYIVMLSLLISFNSLNLLIPFNSCNVKLSGAALLARPLERRVGLRRVVSLAVE